MKQLPIGQLVRVSAIAEVEYDYERESYRTIRRDIIHQPVEPFLAVVVGQCQRCSGHYQRGGIQYPDGEHEPAHLAVDKTVTLWEVRSGMMNKAILVHDEDLEVTCTLFKLPRLGRRAKRVYPEPPAEPVRLLTHEPVLVGEPQGLLFHEYNPKLF